MSATTAAAPVASAAKLPNVFVVGNVGAERNFKIGTTKGGKPQVRFTVGVRNPDNTTRWVFVTAYQGVAVGVGGKIILADTGEMLRPGAFVRIRAIERSWEYQGRQYSSLTAMQVKPLVKAAVAAAA